MALSLAKVDEIRCLLGAGLSQRRTAIEARVSRGSVANVYHDRWAPKYWQRLVDGRAEDEAGPEPTPQQASAIRARAREAAARKTPESIRQLFAEHGPLKLDLRPDDEARYIRVRRKLRRDRKMAREGAYDPRDAA